MQIDRHLISSSLIQMDYPQATWIQMLSTLGQTMVPITPCSQKASHRKCQKTHKWTESRQLSTSKMVLAMVQTVWRILTSKVHKIRGKVSFRVHMANRTTIWTSRAISQCLYSKWMEVCNHQMASFLLQCLVRTINSLTRVRDPSHSQTRWTRIVVLACRVNRTMDQAKVIHQQISRIHSSSSSSKHHNNNRILRCRTSILW